MLRPFFLVALLAGSTLCQGADFAGEPKPKHFGYAALYHLDKGPALTEKDFSKLQYYEEGNAIGGYYRVGLVLSEIYTSLLVELVTFGEEGSNFQVRETHFLNGHTVGFGNSIVKVDKWLGPRRFRLLLGTGEHGKAIDVEIKGKGVFAIDAPKD